ncbi:MAG: hypothetical protein U1F43_28580 [Myxococcota bacterium]
MSALGVLLMCAAAWTGCSDAAKRPIGATCGVSDECDSGLCYEGQCVDPAEDLDGDGLTNGFEAILGSKATLSDSDRDGVLDPDELGPNQELVDSDGDGKADIIESLVDDADKDCIVDQLDPDDGAVDPNGCPHEVRARPFVAPDSGGKTVATSRYRATLVLGQPALATSRSSKHRVILGGNPAIAPHAPSEAP